jgi:DNA-binding transcriptional LysR family regulator
VFREAYPEIALTVAVDVGFADLAKREADVAIRIIDAPPPDLVGRRIASAAAAVYGSENLSRGALERGKLEKLDWVGFETGSSMAFARWMDEHVPNERVTLRVNSAWGMRDAVDAGMGVGIFPCALGAVSPAWRRCARHARVQRAAVDPDASRICAQPRASACSATFSPTGSARGARIIEGEQ